jgi:O-antigen ligase
MTTEPFARRLMQQNVVVLLVAMLVLMPLLTPFTQGVSGRALRNGLFQSIGVLLVVVLVARIELRGGLARLRYLARSGINAPLLLLLIWAVLGAVRVAADRPPPDQAFAVGELLRLSVGALVYFASALHLETRAQLRLLLDCLLGFVIFVVGYGCLFEGSEALTGLSSIFPSRHHLSAILVVLFPLLFGLALRMAERQRRLVAIAAAILCAVGLLLSLERGAWIAAAAGLLTWFLFSRARCVDEESLSGKAGLRATGAPTRAPGSWRLTAAVVAGGLLVTLAFFAVTDVDATVARRARQIPAATAGRDPSFSERVQRWHGTRAMVAEQPFWGWGPGQFVLHQSVYTHLGLPPELIRPYGAGFEEMAYNEYLQITAELGLPGLGLYLLLLAIFFSKTGRALRLLPDGLRRTTLIGCAAGVAAQMVDALANASWRYPECSIFFWLVLGLGVAMIRMAYQGRQPVGCPLEGR